MNRYYPLVAKRAGHRCEYCRAPEVVFNFLFEVEHVIPSSRGTDEPDNLACRACNARKGDATTVLDESTGEDVLLFNPRTERWFDHFQFDTETGELLELSAVGRGTLARLDLNHTFQQTARMLWAQLRLYP